MKIIVFLLFILSLFITPVFVFADNCDKAGSTIVFINGMFTFTREQAETDKRKLEEKFEVFSRRDDVTFLLGYNPTHLAGAGDMVKVAIQGYKGGFLDYDLINILRYVQSKLQTRKILLVGHSQGTFYTNAAYEYLINNGVDENSIVVYNIATPADRVAGDGDYLTSSTDKVINSFVRELTSRTYANKPLPTNIDIKLSPSEESNPLGGHSLSGVYLPNVPERIIGDMMEGLDGLTEGDGENISADNGCFVPPDINNLAYRLKNIGFRIGDPLANGISQAVSSTYKTSDAIIDYAYNLGKEAAATLFSTIRNLFSRSSASPASVYTLYPDSGEQDNTNQPSDLATPEPTGNEDQENLDDYLELQDILNSENANRNQQTSSQSTDNSTNQNLQPPSEQQQPQTTPPTQLTSNTNDNSSGSGGQTSVSSSGGSSGGGSVTRPTYPKILITEIQILPTTERFVELYNPNSTAVGLTDWYIQRKTKTASSWDSFVTSTKFEGKTISANSYFLIGRSAALNPDILLEDLTLSEDNVILLKNPNRDEVDKLGWGQAQEFEAAPTINPTTGKSIARIWDETNQGYKETDNNSVDFEEQNPTPRAKNVSFVPPPPPPPPPAPTDTVAPTVVFNLDPVKTTLNFAVNFELTDLSIENVSPSGLAVFQFRWRKEGEEWQEEAPQTIDGGPLSYSGTKDFTAPQDETTYYFQVKAKDVNGNESDWLPETPATTLVRTPKTILINEIQIDSIVGTGGTDDDWVELYNSYDVDVSLQGWSIQKHSKSEPCSTTTGFYKKNFADDAVIPAKGFYLIVDTEASASLLALADMTIGWSLSANNTVYLVRNQDEIESGDDPDIIDKVGFGSACFPEATPAPTPPEARSIVRKSLGLDTNDNSQDFIISLVLTPKANIVIWDATDYVVSGGSGNPGAVYYYLTIKWYSPSQDIDFYEVQYSVNNNDWQDWFSNTTETQGVFRALDDILFDHIYHFRTRVSDSAGNTSNWIQIDVDVSKPVVINEVALFGTNAGKNDQWIELYNKSDSPIDITNWRLRGGRDGYETFTLQLQGVIPAKGYMILEKSNDQVISDVPAGQIFTQIIPNTYGNFYLENERGRKIDSFYFPAWPGWSEANFVVEDNRYSMERISPYAVGFSSLNWVLNNGVIMNGTDANGNLIHATPGQQNSNYQLYTIISTDFVEDTILPKSLSPYFIYAGNYTIVFPDTTLTIEPGTVIKMSSGLTIRGTLKAIGTVDEPIVFTSYHDDEYGGDTNNSTQPPSAGHWQGLTFMKESVNSELENVVVRYAGVCWPGYPYGGCELGAAGIRIKQTSISLKNSIIQNNSRSGLWLTNSSSIIDSVQILDHQTPPYDGYFLGAKGIFIEGGNPTVTNSNFARNYYGIYMTSWRDENGVEIQPTPILENNTFEDNNTNIWPLPVTPSP